MENRLVPVDARYVKGKSATTLNDACSICGTDLGDLEDILVHPGCQNGFCVDDLMKWVAVSNRTCPNCRGHLGVLRPILFDANKERIYLAPNGIEEVRRVVGACFDDVPLKYRIVGLDRPLEGFHDITDSNSHLAMQGRNELYLAPDEIPMREGRPDAQLKAIDDRYRFDGGHLARCLLRIWTEWEGVEYFSELMFPEYSSHARFIIPKKPDIHVVNSLDWLRWMTTDARVRLRRDYGANHPPGYWLKRVVTTSELLASLPDQSRRSAVHAITVAGGYTNPRLSVDQVSWAFWRSNHPWYEHIFAVPRIEFSMPSTNAYGDVTGYWLSRGFCDWNQQQIYSNPYLSTIGMEDPQLHDFAWVFDEPFEQRPVPIAGNDQEFDVDALVPQHSTTVDHTGRPLPAPGYVWEIVRAETDIRAVDPERSPDVNVAAEDDDTDGTDESAGSTDQDNAHADDADQILYTVSLDEVLDLAAVIANRREQLMNDPNSEVEDESLQQGPSDAAAVDQSSAKSSGASSEPTHSSPSSSLRSRSRSASPRRAEDDVSYRRRSSPLLLPSQQQQQRRRRRRAASAESSSQSSSSSAASDSSGQRP